MKRERATSRFLPWLLPVNFYKHHLGDYASKTLHLSWDEDCAYRRLIDQYYKRELPIPADIKDACRLARAATPAQRKAVEAVLREFFALESDGWHQNRCDDEIAAANAQAATNRRIAEDREARRRTRTEHESLNGSSHDKSTNRSPDTMGKRAESVNLSRLQTPDSISQTPDSKIPNPDIPSHPEVSVAHSLTLDAPPNGQEVTVSKAKRASKRMPPDYEPSIAVRAWAREKTPLVDFETEFSACRDYEFRHARVDWDAVLRGWLLREQKDLARRVRPNGNSQHVTKFARIRGDRETPTVDEHGNEIPF